MDSCDSAQIVFSRVKAIDPANANRVMGYLLLHNADMFALAFSTDPELKSTVAKAKKELLAAENPRSREASPPSPSPSPSPPPRSSGKISPASSKGSSPPPSPPSPEDDSPKLCMYFAKGFCKNGEGCRFIHDKESTVKEHALPMERVEIQLQELLRSRKGVPIPVSALPQLYFEKYGRWLETDGYVAESQRHSKPGYSLTRLLSKLHGVTVVERPHRQHALMLTDDVPKYSAHKVEMDECNDPSPCSRQIYLTFPCDSHFSEEDVATHFRAYGPVEDVRIPTQHRRMFGFVTFTYAETVRMILAEGNPHHVCGARVLVKPYKEKSKPVSKKQMEKMLHPGKNENKGSIIGSDADRRLEEEKKAMKLELLVAEARAKDRAKAEAQAAAALLSSAAAPENMKPKAPPAPPRRDPRPVPRGGGAGGGFQNKRAPDLALEYARDWDQDMIKKLFLEAQLRNTLGLPANKQLAANPPVPNRECFGSCCVCFRGLTMEPIQLGCNHTFCDQCVLKIVQSSTKDECPICSWNAENKVYDNMIRKEEMEPWLPPPAHQQPIW